MKRKRPGILELKEGQRGRNTCRNHLIHQLLHPLHLFHVINNSNNNANMIPSLTTALFIRPNHNRAGTSPLHLHLGSFDNSMIAMGTIIKIIPRSKTTAIMAIILITAIKMKIIREAS